MTGNQQKPNQRSRKYGRYLPEFGQDDHPMCVKVERAGYTPPYVEKNRFAVASVPGHQAVKYRSDRNSLLG